MEENTSLNSMDRRQVIRTVLLGIFGGGIAGSIASSSGSTPSGDFKRRQAYDSATIDTWLQLSAATTGELEMIQLIGGPGQSGQTIGWIPNRPAQRFKTAIAGAHFALIEMIDSTLTVPSSRNQTITIMDYDNSSGVPVLRWGLPTSAEFVPPDQQVFTVDTLGPNGAFAWNKVDDIGNFTPLANLLSSGFSIGDGVTVTGTVLPKPAEAGAQVGIPTGLVGTHSSFARGDHRHAFSGRFVYSGVEFNALLPGGAFPDKFSRIKIGNSWTLRRIWAFTKNGPTGGTETYGIVNAAGALQGTAVTIPASAGAVSEAESALQTTNLTGGTLYYLAQTASTAVVASTNVEVGIEYTMNV